MPKSTSQCHQDTVVALAASHLYSLCTYPIHSSCTYAHSRSEPSIHHSRVGRLFAQYPSHTPPRWSGFFAKTPHASSFLNRSTIDWGSDCRAAAALTECRRCPCRPPSSPSPAHHRCHAPLLLLPITRSPFGSKPKGNACASSSPPVGAPVSQRPRRLTLALRTAGGCSCYCGPDLLTRLRSEAINAMRSILANLGLMLLDVFICSSSIFDRLNEMG
jgi:hypothetical protein